MDNVIKLHNPIGAWPNGYPQKERAVKRMLGGKSLPKLDTVLKWGISPRILGLLHGICTMLPNQDKGKSFSSIFSSIAIGETQLEELFFRFAADALESNIYNFRNSRTVIETATEYCRKASQGNMPTLTQWRTLAEDAEHSCQEVYFLALSAAVSAQACSEDAMTRAHLFVFHMITTDEYSSDRAVALKDQLIGLLRESSAQAA